MLTKTKCLLKTINFYLWIYPLPLAKTCGTNQRKTKGGTLGRKKYFFQKNSQTNLRIGLKIPQKYFRNKNMFKIALYPMQPSARSMHAVYKYIFFQGSPLWFFRWFVPHVCIFVHIYSLNFLCTSRISFRFFNFVQNPNS